MSGSAFPWAKFPSEQEGGDSWGPSGPVQWLVSQLMVASGLCLPDIQRQAATEGSLASASFANAEECDEVEGGAPLYNHLA